MIAQSRKTSTSAEMRASGIGFATARGLGRAIYDEYAVSGRAIPEDVFRGIRRDAQELRAVRFVL